jgi:hypothetical protein
VGKVSKYFGSGLNTNTVKKGSVSSIRWVTIGWYFRFTHQGKSFKAMVKQSDPIHYVPISETIDTISYHNKVRLIDTQRWVDQTFKSDYAGNNWNKTLLDNFYHEYPNGSDREIIADFIRKGGIIYVNTIVSVIEPLDTNPAADLKDNAYWDGDGAPNPAQAYPQITPKSFSGDLSKVAISAGVFKSFASWSPRTRAIFNNLYDIKFKFDPQPLTEATCSIYFVDPKTNQKVTDITVVKTKPMKAFVTSNYTRYYPNPIDITDSAKSTWTSFKKAVATVDDKGVNTGVSNSTTQ